MVDGHYSQQGWKDFPQNVHLARDGEPVRILGAWFGSNLDESDVWSPTLSKLRDTLDRWKKGHSTILGKKHVVQMFIGGMTQYLTDVQRMPADIQRRLMKWLRGYIWDDKVAPPIAMQHLCLPTEEGGL
ncbi:hypothetical protein BD309DRAFT_866204, partial [Dichomitus squalens]